MQLVDQTCWFLLPNSLVALHQFNPEPMFGGVCGCVIPSVPRNPLHPHQKCHWQHPPLPHTHTHTTNDWIRLLTHSVSQHTQLTHILDIVICTASVMQRQLLSGAISQCSCSRYILSYVQENTELFVSMDLFFKDRFFTIFLSFIVVKAPSVLSTFAKNFHSLCT